MKFLEFDEQESWRRLGYDDEREPGVKHIIDGARGQFNDDKEIMLKLLEVNRVLNEGLRLVAFRNVFTGESGWRDEYFISVKQAEETLAEADRAMKEIE